MSVEHLCNKHNKSRIRNLYGVLLLVTLYKSLIYAFLHNFHITYEISKFLQTNQYKRA